MSVLEAYGFFGITNVDGVFEISDVNPGSIELVVTHLGMKNHFETVAVITTDVSNIDRDERGSIES